MERAVFFLWPLLRNDRRREEKECGGGVSPSLLPHFSPMNVRKGSAFLAFGFFCRCCFFACSHFLKAHTLMFSRRLALFFDFLFFS